MNSSYEFVYTLLLKGGDGENYLAISPHGSVNPKDLVLLENMVPCEVTECVYVNRLSEEFKLLEKMMELSEVSAVYAFVWGKPEDDNGTVHGDS